MKEIGRLTFFVILLLASVPAVSQYWQESNKGKGGANEGIFEEAHQYINDINSTNADFHSLLVIKDKKILSEKYFVGFDMDKQNNVKSVTKSIASLLFGIALDQGLIESVDDKLIDVFPDYFVGVDERKKDITMEDLLTMSAGFEWDNDNGSYKSTWWNHKNPNQFAIQYPKLTSEPGSQFNYNSGLSHLLLGIIDKKYQEGSVEDFARKYLFEPMGINRYEWGTDNRGQIRGHSELSLRPRDMAKFGQLVLDRGVFDGKRIVSGKWIDKSTAVANSGSQIGQYGYQWWIKDLGNETAICAFGVGGQFILIFPESKMVIVATSDWNQMRNNWKPLFVTKRFVLDVAKGLLND